MNLKIISRASLFLLLLAITWPSPPSRANPQNCEGDLCSRQYWTDEQRAAVEQRGFGGIWNALGERDREMFPNFYAAGNYLGGLLGDFLGNRYVQGGLEALEQASYGTPGGADDMIIRGLRNAPRILGHTDDAGGLLAIGVLRGSDTLPDLPRIRPGITPTSREEVKALLRSGDIQMITREKAFSDGFRKIDITATHAGEDVGYYSLTRMGEESLEIGDLQTINLAYESGGIASKAVSNYVRANPSIRYLSASIINEPTVAFIDQMITQGHPTEWLPQALQQTPLGRIGHKLGGMQLHRLERTTGGAWDIVVEINR